MLIGQYSTKAESNGRVILPKKIRKNFAKKVIISRGYDNCLLLIDPDNFSQVTKDILRRSFLDPDQRDTERFLLGSAFEVEIDKQGRIIIPEALRQYSKIEDEVVFVGLANRVEIWSKAVWQKHQAYLISHSQEIAKRLLSSQGEEK